MNWRSFRFLRRRNPARPSVHTTRLGLEVLESRLLLSTNVLTYMYGNNSGINTNETLLTPANVSSGAFNKLFNTPVDGQVYAQPLVDNGITIATGPFTLPGAAGVHNVVFVATENDSLYAINADNGAILWQRSFLNAGDPNDALPGATAVTTVPNADVSGASDDLTPQYGITGTPVIDPNTNTLYLIATTKEMVGGTAHYVQRVHAINISDGTDVTTPYVIGDTTVQGGTDVNNTQLYVYGNGINSVTDPYNGTGQQVVQFDARTENQRAALTLVNGTLYVAWGSHADRDPYFGWIAGWNVSDVADNGFQLSGVLNTGPNNSQNGIWQAGAGLSFEPDGSAFYFTTANAPLTQVTLDGNGLPQGGNYAEAVVKAVLDPGSTPQNQNTNGWGFKIVDFFIPYDGAALGQNNQDLATDAAVLPDSAGIPGHPNLLVASGKNGVLYLMDRNNLGQFDPNNDNVLNSVPNGQGNNTPPQEFGGVLSAPIFWNGELYVIGGYSDFAKAFTINSDGSLSLAAQTSNTFGFEPGSPIISANGSSNAILWLMNRKLGELTAYDPNNLGNQLWNSGQGGANSLDSVTKFAVPTVANSMVFIGTMDGLTAYGLGQSNGAPLAPTGAHVTAATSGEIDLAWTDNAGASAQGYQIYRSTAGGLYTLQAALPPGSSSWRDTNVSPGTTYDYHIFAFNSAGTNGFADVSATAATSPIAALSSLLSPTGLNNLVNSIFRMEMDAFWLTKYSSGSLTQSVPPSALLSHIFALIADINANPLFNTPLGNEALQQGFDLAQSSASST